MRLETTTKTHFLPRFSLVEVMATIMKSSIAYSVCHAFIKSSIHLSFLWSHSMNPFSLIKSSPFIEWSFMHPDSINTANQSFPYSSIAHVSPIFVHISSLYSSALSFFASLYSWVFGKFSWHQITDSRHILNSRQTSLSVRVGFNTNLKATTKQSYCFVTDIL